MLVNGRKRINGMSAFVSKDESTMLIFGIGGEPNNTYGLGTPGNTKPFAAVVTADSTWGTIVQQPDASFSSSENIKYTVTRLDDKTIKWQAVGQSSGAKTGGIITSDTSRADAGTTDTALATVYNANVENILKSAYYPMGVLASGDGSSTTNRARAWYTRDENYEKPMFDEDFSLYRNDDATITESDKETGVTEVNNGTETQGEYTGHRLASGAAVLATNSTSGAKWITSDVWTATYSDGTTTRYPGYAYVDTGADALAVQGCAHYHMAAVNLDMGADKKVTELHKAEFTIEKPARNAGVRLFVSGNEKAYIEFGFTGAEESRYGKTDGNLNAPYSPMIRKSVNSGDTNSDGRLTSIEANTYTDVLVYSYDAFAKDSAVTTGIARENESVATSANSTVSTTGKGIYTNEK
jgi:hypothetical protein